jgi:hypothetical protein
MRPLPQLPRQSCPVGATFSEPSLRKSVATFRRKIDEITPLYSRAPERNSCKSALNEPGLRSTAGSVSYSDRLSGLHAPADLIRNPPKHF